MVSRVLSPSEGRFDEGLGIWINAAEPAPGAPRAALFLDRDGVIVEDPGYLRRAADLALIPGAAEVIAAAHRAGVPVVEVTNQAGIARGYYGWPEFVEVEEALARLLAAQGAALDGVFACPYHRDGVGAWAHPDHPARKPRPGMLLAAARRLNLDLARSWIVGDKVDDLLAGRNAGLRGGMHVLTGQGAAHREAVRGLSAPDFELRLGDSIRNAVPLITLLQPPPAVPSQG